MNAIISFLVKNKVFFIGLLASIGVVIQQYTTQTTVDYKVIAYAVLMAVMSYIGNTWRGQGVTILGIIGTLANTFVTVEQGGHFTWNTFIIQSVAAILSLVAPPPKSIGYEQSQTIAQAKANPPSK